MTVNRDVWETPACPGYCARTTCPRSQHEYIEDEQQWARNDVRFLLIMMRLRKPENEPPLSFLRFAGVALMVNSERGLPAGSFENCKACGAGAEGCDCTPNLLAILAREEGGSEWQ